MRQIKKGSTNVSVEVYIVDDTDGTPETGVVFSSADLNYRRDGAVVTSITEVTLAALTTAHTDGGFLHVANGRYRLDVPDAAFATGVSQVTIGGTVTGMVVLPVTVQLVDFDPDDAVRLGMTALPAAAADAAGGLPISDAGGQDFDAMNTAAVRLTAARAGALTDWINAGRLDAILDIIAADTTTDIPALIATAQADLDIITGTDGVTLATAQANYAPARLLSTGTAQAGTSTTITLAAGDSAITNTYQSAVIKIMGGTGVGQHRICTQYVGSTKVATVTSSWLTTPDNTSVYEVVPGRADVTTINSQYAPVSALATWMQDEPVDYGAGDSLMGNIADMAGAGFVTGTDSQQAIRDRGDAAWSGAGGGTTVIAVAATVQSGEVTSPKLIAQLSGSKTWGFTFVDQDGVAIDVNTDSLKMIVERADGTDSFDVDATGSSNTGSFAVSAAQHATVGLYSYVVRNVTNDGFVLAHGAYEVIKVPVVDA